ncbi:MAG: electron transfer flavoprotein-ubiquinone oxidoreductase [Planctomycetaceae bacterium]|nr:electron transfer flavoprotein-ubiquinone oxidoreductase [Planctomycetaceae bacterium]
MAERETLEVDVLFVGGGPACLAGAYHLAGLLAKENERLAAEGRPALQPSILLIDKAAEIGFHALSGAVLDPRALKELWPDFAAAGCPLEGPVVEDEVWFLTKGGKWKAPWIPAPLRNHGNFVASLGKVVRWMAAEVEKRGGVDVYPGFGAAEPLVEDGKVVGVRCGDKGVGRDGKRKDAYEPGIDIRAKITILGEGPRGTVTKILNRRFRLDEGRNPQIYALGIKEIWQMPAGTVKPGRVFHTMGWPLDRETFGGGFVYTMANDMVDLGLVVGLDYRNPHLDPHGLFQALKTHPAVRPLLAGGKMVHYGAKALPEGGWYSIPRAAVAGCMIVGDSASLLNPMRLKGIHTGMKSGMIAAEVALEALLQDEYTADFLSRYEDRVRASWIGEELKGARNFHQGFEKGFWRGLLNAGLMQVNGGKGFGERTGIRAGHEHMRKLSEHFGARVPEFARERPDGTLTFDRVTDVYSSGTLHEADQPPHLRVADPNLCATKCATEYGNPCTRFCPAAVYEMVDAEGAAPGKPAKRLQINFENCVHCKTCDIMDPYQVIDWTTPEGGDGPRYANL